MISRGSSSARSARASVIIPTGIPRASLRGVVSGTGGVPVVPVGQYVLLSSRASTIGVICVGSFYCGGVAVPSPLSSELESWRLPASLAPALSEAQAILPLWRTTPPSVVISTEVGLVTGETALESGRSAVTWRSCDDVSK
jgi:hypothetical protein